ncbi:MAG: kelch repeat-containing protein [Planctomycetota bacterium]
MRTTLTSETLAAVVTAAILGTAGHTQDWQRLDQSLAPAEGMVFDAGRDRLVIWVPRGPTAGTWEWDGFAWAKRATASMSPPPRSGSAMAYDPVTRTVLLSGGFSDGFGIYTLDELWSWDGVRWTRISNRGLGRRGYHAMVTDEQRGRVLLHGGTVDLAPTVTGLDGTFEWDGRRWNRIATGPPIALHQMAYDSARQRTVLFGGNNGHPEICALDDRTWEFDGVAWSQTAATSTPRDGHGMAYDPERQRVVMFGGSVISRYSYRCFPDGATLEYDGSTWQRWPGEGPTPFGLSLEYIPTIGLAGLLNGTLQVFDGASWSPLRTPNRLPGLGSAATTYDVVGQRTVLYADDQTWLWNGGGWRLARGTSAPGVRNGHAVAYDERASEVILFGGAGGGNTGTWAWNGATWTRRALHGPDRRGHAMAYDRARDELVLFGGLVAGSASAETWVWDGSSWNQRQPPAAPPARHGAAMAYDAARQRIVLFGGAPDVTSGTLFADTWIWDGTAWQQIATPTMPPGRAGHGLAYDEQLRAVVLADAGSWAFDGLHWQRLATTANPAGRVSLSSDRSRRRLVAVVNGRETWEFGRVGVASAVRFGAGCATTVERVTLSSFGPPRIGRLGFALDLGGAPAAAPGAFLLSSGSASLPIAAECVLRVDPRVAAVVPFIANRGGFATLPLPLPIALGPSGATAFAQAALVEPLAAGLALSDGLQLTLGER